MTFRRVSLALGNDYSEGVRGVGIVNAMEIIGAFQSVEDLREFRTWVECPSVMESTEKHHGGRRADFCATHVNMKKNWLLPRSFPQSTVSDAFLRPEVDRNPENFTEGAIDFEGIQRFCYDKLGWTPKYVRDQLSPVMKASKEIREPATHRQSNLLEFWQFEPER